MTTAAMGVPSRRAEMWYAGTSRQSRLSVAFRILLGIPHYFVLFFLYIAMFFVAIIGWIAALIMGRLPIWAHTYISGVTRWTVRVDAYIYLLTDRYPPFSFDDEDYPARPFPPPEDGRLNRWAVLFRVFLYIPANVFLTIVNYGLTFPLLFGAWIIVLVQGEMPSQLYVPYSALVRYHLRAQSYFLMLTSEYPWGMLGDREAGAVSAQPFYGAPPSAAAPPSSTPPGSPPPYSYPSEQGPGSSSGPPPDAETAGSTPAPPQPPPSQPYSYPSEQGPASTAAPPSYPGATGQQPPPPPPPSGFGAMPEPSPEERAAPPPGGRLPEWATLVLTGAARGWMIFAIVWGSILFVGQEVARSAATSNNNNHSMYVPAPAPHHDTFV